MSSMKLRLPFCPPLIHTVEGQVRFGRLLLCLPGISEVTFRVFRRREIRRLFSDNVETWDVTRA